MNKQEYVHDAYVNIAGDSRVSPLHISMYMGILHYWTLNLSKNQVAITRRQIMVISHIKSIVTYHKLIQELKEWGYIIYRPSFHPQKGSEIELPKL